MPKPSLAQAQLHSGQAPGPPAVLHWPVLRAGSTGKGPYPPCRPPRASPVPSGPRCGCARRCPTPGGLGVSTGTAWLPRPLPCAGTPAAPVSPRAAATGAACITSSSSWPCRGQRPSTARCCPVGESWLRSLRAGGRKPAVSGMLAGTSHAMGTGYAAPSCSPSVSYWLWISALSAARLTVRSLPPVRCRL